MMKVLESLALQKITKRAYKYIFFNVSILQREDTEYDTTGGPLQITKGDYFLIETRNRIKSSQKILEVEIFL